MYCIVGIKVGGSIPPSPPCGYATVCYNNYLAKEYHKEGISIESYYATRSPSELLTFPVFNRNSSAYDFRDLATRLLFLFASQTLYGNKGEWASWS